MKPHAQQVYSEPWVLNKKINLIIKKAANGPIFTWGSWDGSKFNQYSCGKFYSFTNTMEDALKYLKAHQQA